MIKPCRAVAAVNTVIHKIKIKVIHIDKIFSVVLKGIYCKFACAWRNDFIRKKKIIFKICIFKIQHFAYWFKAWFYIVAGFFSDCENRSYAARCVFANVFKKYFAAVACIVDSVWYKPNTAVFFLLFLEFREVCSDFGKVVSVNFFKIINARLFSFLNICVEIFGCRNFDCPSHTSYNIISINLIWRFKQIFCWNKFAVSHGNGSFVITVWNIRSETYFFFFYVFKAEFTFTEIVITCAIEFCNNIVRVVRYQLRRYFLVSETKFKFNIAAFFTSEQPLCNKNIHKKFVALYIKCGNFANSAFLCRQNKRPHIFVFQSACFSIKIYHIK